MGKSSLVTVWNRRNWKWRRGLLGGTDDGLGKGVSVKAEDCGWGRKVDWVLP